MTKSSNGTTTGDWSGGTGVIPGRDTLGPLALMFVTPIVSIVFFHVCAHMNGDFITFATLCYQNGIVNVITSIWPSCTDSETWTMITSFMAFELFLMKIVPGKRFEGSFTPKGNVPVYTANGMACYLITLATLLALAHYQIFDPARVYDKFGNILSSMNVFAWMFCTMLLIKGYVAPSSTDSGTTGNLIHDFYWVRLSACGVCVCAFCFLSLSLCVCVLWFTDTPLSQNVPLHHCMYVPISLCRRRHMYIYIYTGHGTVSTYLWMGCQNVYQLSYGTYKYMCGRRHPTVSGKFSLSLENVAFVCVGVCMLARLSPLSYLCTISLTHTPHRA
jgi:hypothetical protein